MNGLWGWNVRLGVFVSRENYCECDNDGHHDKNDKYKDYDDPSLS